MDTTPLEEKIKAIEAEIAADHEKIQKIKSDSAKHIDLVKDNITLNKRVLKAYQDGLSRLKENGD